MSGAMRVYSNKIPRVIRSARPDHASMPDPRGPDDGRTLFDLHTGANVHGPFNPHLIPRYVGVQPTQTPGFTSLPGMGMFSTSPLSTRCNTVQ